MKANRKTPHKLFDHYKKQSAGSVTFEQLKASSTGWAAGRTCGLKHLTIHGFENVTALSDPSLEELWEAIRNVDDSDEERDAFWVGLIGSNYEELATSPEFTRAFVHSVKVLWGQVSNRFRSELAIRSVSASDGDEPSAPPKVTPPTPTPKRPIRRGPSDRRGTRRWDADRGTGRW